MAVFPVAMPIGSKTSNIIAVLYIVAFQFSGYFCNVVSFHTSMFI